MIFGYVAVQALFTYIISSNFLKCQDFTYVPKFTNLWYSGTPVATIGINILAVMFCTQTVHLGPGRYTTVTVM